MRLPPSAARLSAPASPGWSSTTVGLRDEEGAERSSVRSDWARAFEEIKHGGYARGRVDGEGSPTLGMNVLQFRPGLRLSVSSQLDRATPSSGTSPSPSDEAVLLRLPRAGCSERSGLEGCSELP